MMRQTVASRALRRATTGLPLVSRQHLAATRSLRAPRAEATPISFVQSFALQPSRLERRSFAQQAGSAAQEEEAEAPRKGADSDAGANDEKAATDQEAEAASPSKEETTQPSEAELLKKEVEELQEKLRAKKHELLLSLADFENNKKKFMKERETRRRNATVNFARKMVEVYTEFEDLARLPAEADELSEACQGLHEGVVLTGDLYKAALERFNVSALSPELGEPFSVTYHEDAGSVPGELPPNSVAEVVQPGWAYAEGGSNAAARVVLRKAKVKLAIAEAE
mmetsp:Transcript_102601/g.289922  ORF Transcript_102601/g.289922 Transcript_102601/m.289922 type:complete len:282 (-) Transcript_102601:150-995(-)